MESIAVYVVGVSAFIVYVAFAPDSQPSFLAALLVLAALQVITGYVIGDMKALGLIFFLPVFASFVPAPQDAHGEGFPLALGVLMFVAPCAVILMTVGVGIRALVRWHRGAESRP